MIHIRQENLENLKILIKINVLYIFWKRTRPFHWIDKGRRIQALTEFPAFWKYSRDKVKCLKLRKRVSTLLAEPPSLSPAENAWREWRWEIEGGVDKQGTSTYREQDVSPLDTKTQLQELQKAFRHLLLEYSCASKCFF